MRPVTLPAVFATKSAPYFQRHRSAIDVGARHAESPDNLSTYDGASGASPDGIAGCWADFGRCDPRPAVAKSGCLKED